MAEVSPDAAAAGGGEPATELGRLELDPLHRRIGARFVAEGGIAVPGDYGDPLAERAALRDGYGVIDLSWAGRLELRGRDRQRFLNGLVTANVKDLAPARGVYGLVTTKQGRVLADVYATALEDRLWLELPAGTHARVREHLERYRVIDDVEVASLDDFALVAVVGPGAPAAIGGGADALELDATGRVRVDGTEVQVMRRALFGVEGFVLWAPSSLAGDVFEGLVERGAINRGRAAGLSALDARRIEAGYGRFGVDFGEETVANDTGLVDEAIDFTKGCYLGQEIVARIHYRGKPSTVSMPVEVHGPEHEPAVPATIRIADGEVNEAAGTLTSVAASFPPGSWLGIAALSRRALDEGRSLALDGGGDVRTRARAPWPSSSP